MNRAITCVTDKATSIPGCDSTAPRCSVSPPRVFPPWYAQTIDQTGWHSDEIRWIVPHQANARILKAAAKRSGVSFDRFFLNVENVGNTSSASIPLAILDIESELAAGDRLILCSVGAGITTGAVSVEW